MEFLHFIQLAVAVAGAAWTGKASQKGPEKGESIGRLPFWYTSYTVRETLMRTSREETHPSVTKGNNVVSLVCIGWNNKSFLVPGVPTNCVKGDEGTLPYQAFPRKMLNKWRDARQYLDKETCLRLIQQLSTIIKNSLETSSSIWSNNKNNTLQWPF